LALLGQATPNFWLGMILIIIFGVELKILPISGRGTPAHIILPATTLALASVGYFVRLMRSSMLDVLGQDYMRTAKSKGATNTAILYQHGLKNALIPVITMMGMQFGNILTGAFIVETVFAWPGIGRLGVTSLFERDFPVIQGVIVLSSAVFVLSNLLVDILYSVLDPRIRMD
jgi:peptide/nickel transport system permease protein